MSEPSYLQDVLSQGKDKATAVADRTLARVQDALGFLRP
jgi:tryptophanyl-tRNA synthetase